jgi:uncharacterized protein (DUF433 family)
MSNENLVSRIAVDPGICHWKPCVRGLRYPVETNLEYLAGGDTADELLAEFPDLEREDILACHEYSRQLLAAKRVHLTLARDSSWMPISREAVRGAGKAWS